MKMPRWQVSLWNAMRLYLSPVFSLTNRMFKIDATACLAYVTNHRLLLRSHLPLLYYNVMDLCCDSSFSNNTSFFIRLVSEYAQLRTVFCIFYVVFAEVSTSRRFYPLRFIETVIGLLSNRF